MKHKFKKGQRVRVTKASLTRMERNVSAIGTLKVEEWRRRHKLGGVVVVDVCNKFGAVFLQVDWVGEKSNPHAHINGAEVEPF